MATDIEEQKKPLAERVQDQVAQLGDSIQGSQAWNSIFRPGSIFRKGYALHERVLRPAQVGVYTKPADAAPGEEGAPQGQG